MKFLVFADLLRGIKSYINELSRFLLAASKMPRWIHLLDDSCRVDLEGRISDDITSDHSVHLLIPGNSLAVDDARRVFRWRPTAFTEKRGFAAGRIGEDNLQG